MIMNDLFDDAFEGMKPKLVRLEGDITHDRIRETIRLFIDSGGLPLAYAFDIDFSQIGFVDPAGVTALTNISFYLHQQGCTLNAQGELTHYQGNAGSRFLDDVGFYHLVMGRPFRADVCCPTHARPIYKLEWQGYSNWFYNQTVPWLASMLRAAPDVPNQWGEMYTVLGEIFANIKDHAGENAQIASVYMEYYPQKNEIHIAISDFGVGIPANVRRIKPELTNDTGAIMQAIEDGFTTKSVPANRGAGLDTLIKNVVISNGGTVKIVSWFGEADFYRRDDSTLRAKFPLFDIIDCYPGTLIYLTMPVTIETDELEDMQW